MAAKAPIWSKNILSVRFRTVGLQTPTTTAAPAPAKHHAKKHHAKKAKPAAEQKAQAAKKHHAKKAKPAAAQKAQAAKKHHAKKVTKK